MQADLFLVADDNFTITVNVTNPQQVKSTFSSYTTYTLVGEDKEGIYAAYQGKFEAIRRYSDFDAMRNAMLVRWPGCFVPPLPPKKLLNNNESTFVQERRRLLELFCMKLAQLKHLWYSEEFQIFLRSSNPDIDKAIKNIPTQTNDQLIKKYEDKFNRLSGKDINTTILAKITSFSNFAKKAYPMLSNFKEMVQNFLQLRAKHNQQFESYLGYLMPEYEKNCLSEYVNQNVEGKFIFADSKDEKLAELIAQMKNFAAKPDFLYLYYMLELEEREVQAYTEIFKYREGYEEKLQDYRIKEKDLNIKYQELMAGKRNFLKSLFKTSLQDEKKEVEMEIDKVKMQKQNFVFITQISTVILGHFEIDRFKAEKSKSYFKVLAQISRCQEEYAAIREEIFAHILENHNLV